MTVNVVTIGKTNMTRPMSERIFSGRSHASATVPPRDPDDDEDEEGDDADENDDREPAVIREPDED